MGYQKFRKLLNIIFIGSKNFEDEIGGLSGGEIRSNIR